MPARQVLAQLGDRRYCIVTPARMTTRSIAITADIAFGGDHPPLFIAGPCVIEGLEHALKMARTLAAAAR